MTRGRYTRVRVTDRFLESVAPPSMHALDRVLLYEFETGSSALLAEHREALDRYVLPSLDRDRTPVSVWIGGLASRRGSEALNRSLALRRALAVEGYLTSRAPGLTLPFNRHAMVTTSYGDRLSAYHTENSEYYRSVLVVISRFAHPELPAPPPPRVPGVISTRFRIKSRGPHIDGGEIVAFGAYGYQIDYDPDAAGAPPSDPANYRLIAGGVGAGLPINGGLPDINSPWNYFISPTPTTTRSFAGGADLLSIVDTQLRFRFDATVLTLHPGWGNDSISIAPYRSSGVNVAIGISWVIGQLRLVDG